MHSHSPVLMMGGYRPSPEPNFFDRFDRKEQTGLGGRNKTFASPPLPGGPDEPNLYGQLPPHVGGRWHSPALGGAADGSSPIHGMQPIHGMDGLHGMPVGGGGGAMPPQGDRYGAYNGGGAPPAGPLYPPALSEYDMLLLKGIRPPGQPGLPLQLGLPLQPPPLPAAARTYHTSALLDLSHTGCDGMLHGGTSAGGGAGEGDDFFEQVAQLRSSQGTHLQLTNGHTEEVNVYGTPLNTAKQRQLELLRRPSFHDVEPLPVVGGGGGGYYVPPHQREHLPSNSGVPPQITSPHFVPVGRQHPQNPQ
jgi:hypothetical protein